MQTYKQPANDKQNRQQYERNKDYSARYGRTHTIGGHRYEDANAPYASGSGRKIYATADYDNAYLTRRLHSSQ